MIKMWAKVISNKKIEKQSVFSLDEEIDYSLFFDYIKNICDGLEIPTPVIVKTHIFNYAKYNFVRFTPQDFVESVSFDRLEIENIAR